MKYLKNENGAQSTVEYQGSKLVLESTQSPDMNGDGISDYSSERTCTYNSSGLLAVDETKFYFDGVQSTVDYIKVEKTYTPAGKADVTLTDDWAYLDFIIGRDCDYDSSGRLVLVKEMDPFDYGDELYHQTGKVTYNTAAKSATFTGSAVYDSGHEDGWGFGNLTVQTLSKTASYSKELVTSKDASGKIVFRMQEEKWFDGEGKLTTVLESFDKNLDGKFNPGSGSGYKDFRTKEILKYDSSDVLVSHTVDEGVNGSIDYTMTLTPMDDMLIA